MFGDLMGMMGKLKETKAKIEATRTRLDTVYIEERSADDLVEVKINANRKLKDIRIQEALLKDRELLEDLLVQTLNRAIEKAGEVQEAELGAVAREGMPNIPGIDSLFK